MKDYQFFEFEDFLEDADFQRWVYRPTAQDTLFWNQWLASHPEKAAVVEQTRHHLLDIKGSVPVLSEDYISQKVAQIVEQAKVANDTPIKPLPVVRRFTTTWYYAAASVVLLLGLFWIYQIRLSDSVRSEAPIYAQLTENATYPLLEVANKSKLPKKITLADGSTVVLYKNSRISYPEQFGGTSREVYLTGQAFFQVQKNPNKPFLVYANELVTKVLGTSFFVKAYEQDKDVQVVVRTGRVSVFAKTDKQAPQLQSSPDLGALILTPNQQAILKRTDKQLVRSLVALPVRIDLPQKLTTSFVFKQTPIAEVFAALERAYGVDIVFDETTMAHCTLTARLDDESLFKKLEWICAGTESSYEAVDGKIIITSKGCV
jgi:ferric-dicitrate binding protein FerR (iron transport regulator)